MRAVLDIVLIVLDLYVWLLIASAILSWLIAFNVVNTRNQFVSAVAEFLYRITERMLAPIRYFLRRFRGAAVWSRFASAPSPKAARPIVRSPNCWRRRSACPRARCGCCSAPYRGASKL